MELKKARAQIRELDRRIAEGQRQNEQLAAAVEAAQRHDFPAEKVAREELHLVSPEDIVLLYPAGSLTTPEGKAGGAPLPTPPARQ
jgi:cell division protein FtsB